MSRSQTELQTGNKSSSKILFQGKVGKQSEPIVGFYLTADCVLVPLGL